MKYFKKTLILGLVFILLVAFYAPGVALAEAGDLSGASEDLSAPVFGIPSVSTTGEMQDSQISVRAGDTVTVAVDISSESGLDLQHTYMTVENPEGATENIQGAIAGEGTYEFVYTVPRDAPAGAYVLSLQAQDIYGNSTAVTLEDDVTVIADSVTTPLLGAMSDDPDKPAFGTAVFTTSGTQQDNAITVVSGDTVTVTVEVSSTTDLVFGAVGDGNTFNPVTQMVVTRQRGNWRYPVYVPGMLVEGNKCQFVYTVPDNPWPGGYDFRVYAYNAAGKSANTYAGKDEVSVTVVNPDYGDADQPVFGTPELSETSTYPGGTITLTVPIEDETPLVKKTVMVYGPTYDYSATVQGQHVADDLYKFEFEVPANWPLGECMFALLSAEDSNGNSEAEWINVPFTLNAAVKVTQLTLDRSSLTLYEGESHTLTATILPENASNKAVSWVSSDTSVATVSENGEVTGVGPGSATITATAKLGDNAAAECAVTVKSSAITSVTLNKTQHSLYSGQTYALVASYLPADTPANTLTWASSDDGIATVTPAGVVEGISPGQVEISVTAPSGESAQCDITVLSPDITSIILDFAQLTLQRSKTQKLTASYLPADTPASTLDWASSDDGIATVTADGLVQGVSPGQATITVTTLSGETAECDVTVTALFVSSIKLDTSAVTVPVGSSFTPGVTVAPADADDAGITWTSSDAGVATVSETGKVTGIKAGKVTITATAKDGNGAKASYTVYVGARVSKITMSQTSATLLTGKTVSLKATIAPVDAAYPAVTWASSNTSVATVSSSGVVKGIKPGTVTITATAKDGSKKTASCKITVKQAVTGLKLNQTARTIPIGKTYTLTATASPSTAANKAVTWKSSNTSVATVTSTGVVKGIKKGTVTITATAKDGSGVKATATIYIGKYVTGLKLNTTARTVEVGKTTTLTATASPTDASYKAVSWKSSDTAIATVSSGGVVKGIKAGKVTITATARDGSGKQVTATIYVGKRVTSLKMNTSARTIAVGKTYTLTATASPSNASYKAVTWKSSDKSIATVSSAGVVKGIKKGKVTITATAKDGSGISVTSTIYVGTYVSGVKLNTSARTVPVGKTYTLTATVSPTGASYKAVSWKSSNTAVATVTSGGVVKGIKAGKVTITATAKDGSGKAATATIYVGPHLTGITLNKKTATIMAGKTVTLTATGAPSSAPYKSVTWKSSNTSIATVSSAGVVTGIKRGTVTVTATAKDGSGKTTTCKVVVEPPPIKLVEGMYKVGWDIPSGTYVLTQASSYMAYFCISGAADGSSIIANDNFKGNSIITVTSGQYLQVKRCTGLIYAKAASLFPVNGYFQDGMYEVGKHIQPGTYKLTSTDSSLMGYYAVTKDAKHTLSSIVANKNFKGSVYVTLEKGQFIKISRCKLKV